MLNLASAVVGAALCLLGVSTPAWGKTGQTQMLTVQGAVAASTIQPMRIFWKKQLGEETKTTLLGQGRRTVAVPGRFYVGTQLSMGRSSVHLWTFESDFLRGGGAQNGLRLALNADSDDCFTPQDIRRMGQRYDAARSTNDLLSGAILFGHLREVCRLKGNVTADKGAEEADKQVDAIYKILMDRQPRSFTGRMCEVTRTNVSC